MAKRVAIALLADACVAADGDNSAVSGDRRCKECGQNGSAEDERKGKARHVSEQMMWYCRVGHLMSSAGEG